MDFDLLPTAIDAHPDAAHQLGRVVAAWSVVELLVSALFARVIDDTGPLTVAILHQFHRIPDRLDVINNVIDETVADAKGRDHLKALTGEVRRLSKERNRLVHGLWGVNKKTGALVLKEGITTTRKRAETSISAEEIAQLAREIIALTKRLRIEIFPEGAKPIDLSRLVERQSP